MPPKRVPAVGERFGVLEVLGEVPPGPDWKTRVRVSCHCGRPGCHQERVVMAACLYRGMTTSCGATGKDLAGQPFGLLKVISFAGRDERNSLLWLVECRCGRHNCRHQFTVRASQLLGAKIRCCGGRRRITDLGRTLSRHYSAYKGSAKKRRLEFTLSQEAFEQLCIQPCYYCGLLDQKPIFTQKKGDHTSRTTGLNGIDRVDNTRGYEITNCVPCCATCNRIKLALPEQAFVDHCQRVATHQIGQGMYTQEQLRELQAAITQRQEEEHEFNHDPVHTQGTPEPGGHPMDRIPAGPEGEAAGGQGFRPGVGGSGGGSDLAN